MDIKPIPKRLLIHSVTVKSVDEYDRNRNPHYTTFILHNVRMALTAAQTNGQAGSVTADTATLYIDVINSYAALPDGTPAPLAIPMLGEAVEYNGREYIVQSIAPRFTHGVAAAHHWEITLT